MAFIVTLLQFFLSLSLLVVIHEFGHFLFARLFKIRVEKFYFSSTHGSPCINISRRTVTRPSASGGFPWADM